MSWHSRQWTSILEEFSGFFETLSWLKCYFELCDNGIIEQDNRSPESSARFGYNQFQEHVRARLGFILKYLWRYGRRIWLIESSYELLERKYSKLEYNYNDLNLNLVSRHRLPFLITHKSSKDPLYDRSFSRYGRIAVRVTFVMIVPRTVGYNCLLLRTELSCVFRSLSERTVPLSLSLFPDEDRVTMRCSWMAHYGWIIVRPENFLRIKTKK